MSILASQSNVQMKRVSHGNYLMRTLLKHNVIFHEGQHGDTAFILVEGKVEISGTVDGRKKVFAILKPVSIFGEMALFLDDQTRTATAIALEDSKVVVVTRDDLDEYIAGAPQVISSIMSVLVSRLKSTTKKALKVPNVPLGICRVLDLFALNGHLTMRYDSAVRSLSEIFVTSTEAVERYLQALAGKGHIHLMKDAQDNRTIRLASQDFLQTVMESSKKK